MNNSQQLDVDTEDELVLFCTEYTGKYPEYVDFFLDAKFGTFAYFFQNKSKWLSSMYQKPNGALMELPEKREFVKQVATFVRKSFKNSDEIINGSGLMNSNIQSLPNLSESTQAADLPPSTLSTFCNSKSFDEPNLIQSHMTQSDMSVDRIKSAAKTTTTIEPVL